MPTSQTTFRLPLDLLERLDRYAERLRQQMPGLPVTRADAARVLLTKALDAAEADEPAARRRKR